ncbi:MAG: bifunctional oligoribonuclease/PAP phosphatase NrnA, partial [Acidobacteriota bacterium]
RETPQLPPPQELLDALRAGRRFVLTSHVGPDGDAIGSGLGLARVLSALGKDSVVWNRDPAPRFYAPLPGSAGIHVGEEPPTGFPEDFDAVVVLECPSLERCGLEEQVRQLPLFNIDHHLGNDAYGAIDWVDPRSPSLGAMIFRLARALGVEVDADTATTLYLTLVTDTGGFRFPNATREAFQAAAMLVERGAEPAQVAHWLYESQPLAAVRLIAEVLSSLELHLNGRIATVFLERAMVERCGAEPGDSEGLIDYPRSIAGVEAVALLRELPEGRVKVSLRSRGDIDVEAVARQRGGGGHKNAAGVTLPEPIALERARQQIVESLAAALP